VQVSVIISLSLKSLAASVKKVTAERIIGLRITNPHHTVDKNGVHLKITTFSCIKLNY